MLYFLNFWRTVNLSENWHTSYYGQKKNAVTNFSFLLLFLVRNSVLAQVKVGSKVGSFPPKKM